MISEAEYTRLIEAQTGVYEISKKRAYVVHIDGAKHYCLEIDQYDPSSLSANLKPHIPDGEWGVIEIETNHTGPINFPQWVEVIEEVTGHPMWSNQNMAALVLKQRGAP